MASTKSSRANIHASLTLKAPPNGWRGCGKAAAFWTFWNDDARYRRFRA